MIPALKEEQDFERFDEEQILQWLHHPVTQRLIDELRFTGYIMQQEVTESHKAAETTEATFKSGQVYGLAEAASIPEGWLARIKEAEDRHGEKEKAGE